MTKKLTQKLREEEPLVFTESLLKYALGFVKIQGLADISARIRSVLDYALEHNHITQEQIDNAQEYYKQEKDNKQQQYLQEYFSD